MEELGKILRDNYKKYPKSELRDYIKLIYQNEFAGGHMIKDSRDSFRRLLEEHRQIELDKSFQAYEYIGNGLYRLNLQAFEEEDLERINRIFVKTGNLHKGKLEFFERKLDLLRDIINRGQVNLGLDDFDNFIRTYKEKRYPPISHSQRYRDAYRPAYRIVGQNFLKEE